MLDTAPAATLETQTLEFKGWCRHEKELSDKISEAAVCLANSEGGMVIIGVDDKQSGSAAITRCPYPSVTPDWVRKRIRDLTSPPVGVHIFRVGDHLPATRGTAAADVLIIKVSKTTNPSGHRTHNGVSFVRIDTECRPQYIIDSADYTSVWLEHASLTLIDSASLRKAITLRQTHYPHLTDPDLLPIDHLRATGLARLSESARTAGPDSHVPSIAALLLLGNEADIRAELAPAETVLSVETEGLSPLTTVNSFNIVIALDTYIGVIRRHLDAHHSFIPHDTIRELLLNALIHRCYRTPAPIHIRIAPRELEISNPGGLLGDLTADTLLYAPAVYRNFTLADAARQFGLCEKAGAGINKVFKQLATDGYDFPCFDTSGTSFKVIINTQRDAGFAKFIQDYAGTLQLSLTELIILRVLRSNSESAVADLAHKAQRPREYVKNALNAMLQRHLIAHYSPRDAYRLSDSVLERLALYDDHGQLRLL
jgi:ATP-dependent DNA helicase RecG